MVVVEMVVVVVVVVVVQEEEEKEGAVNGEKEEEKAIFIPSQRMIRPSPNRRSTNQNHGRKEDIAEIR